MGTVIPDFTGQTIIKMKIEGGLSIWTRENWEIQLNGDTYLTSHNAGTVEVENTVYRDDLPEELKRLVGQEISSLLVSAEGDMAVTIGDTQLSVRVGRDHEAWEIGGPKGELIICMPGGELAVWGPRI